MNLHAAPTHIILVYFFPTLLFPCLLWVLDLVKCIKSQSKSKVKWISHKGQSQSKNKVKEKKGYENCPEAWGLVMIWGTMYSLVHFFIWLTQSFYLYWFGSLFALFYYYQVVVELIVTIVIRSVADHSNVFPAVSGIELLLLSQWRICT